MIGATTGASRWPEGLVFAFALFASGPHYGATILRAYEARDDRKRYALFSLHATLVLAVAFVVATRHVGLASVLITAYLTWSPWHFSGQNYGLTMLFLRRRGVAPDARARRLLHASFVLSTFLSILAIHQGHRPFDVGVETIDASGVPHLLALRLPDAWAASLALGIGAAMAVCLGTACWRLRPRGRVGALAPALLLLATQGLWITMPAVVSLWNRTYTESLVLASVWISVAHALQYLWVTSYFARSTANDGPSAVRRFLLKSLFAGTAVTVLPALLMAPHLLGAIPWDAGLAATAISIVNLHHFVLDGALWKLRDRRVAGVLLREPVPAGATPPPIVPAAGTRWGRRAIWTAAALSFAVPIGSIYGVTLLTSAERAEHLEEAARILRWFGRDTTRLYLRIGRTWASEGDPERAREAFLRSVDLFPTGAGWLAIGDQNWELGRVRPALASFERAAALNPELANAHFGRARALLTLASLESPSLRQRAVAALARALEIAPGHARAASLLAQVHASRGRHEEARRILERALDHVGGQRAQALREQLASLSRSPTRGSPR